MQIGNLYHYNNGLFYKSIFDLKDRLSVIGKIYRDNIFLILDQSKYNRDTMEYKVIDSNGLVGYVYVSVFEVTCLEKANDASR